MLRYLLAYHRRDLDGMEAEVRKAAALAPPGRDDLINAAIWIGLLRGRYDDVRRDVEAYNRERSFEYEMIIVPGYVEWKTGNSEAADSLFKEGERRSREMIAQAPAEIESYVDMARIASTRGDTEEAMTWMERVYEHGGRDVANLRMDPALENVRRDPRFERLMQRIEADVARMRERAPKERP
jgi:hypothetical protein